MTREHVLPRWLLQYLDETTGSGNVTVDRADASLSIRELITRRVCTDCNSGWMSQLEAMTKPIMLQMMTKKVWLEPVHQAILARWAVKTMLTAHLAASARRDDLWLTPAAYKRFASGPIEMPDPLTVLLGAYEGQIGADVGVEPVHMEVRRTAHAGAKPTIRLIMRVLAVVFHVQIIPRGQLMHLTVEEPLKERLHLIWPPLEHATVAAPVHWPPAATFAQTTLAELWNITPALGAADHKLA